MPSGDPLACLLGLSSSSLVVPRWSVLGSLVLRVLSVVDMRGVVRWIRTAPCSDPALGRGSRSWRGVLLALVVGLGLICFRFGQIRSLVSGAGPWLRFRSDFSPGLMAYPVGGLRAALCRFLRRCDAPLGICPEKSQGRRADKDAAPQIIFISYTSGPAITKGPGTLGCTRFRPGLRSSGATCSRTTSSSPSAGPPLHGHRGRGGAAAA